MATATIHWLSPSEGGRKFGPPSVQVYMTTAVFQLDSEEETQPGWPWTADLMLSILIQRTESLDAYKDLAIIGFLVPDLAQPMLYAGSKIVITEGPHIVAYATINELLS